MRKSIILIVAILCVMPFAAEAQRKVKFGHLDMEAVYDAMPGKDTLDAAFMAYKSSLEEEGLAMQKELENVLADFQKKQASMSQAQIRIKQEEMQKMYQKMQEFAADAKELLEDKKTELLMPYQTMIINAAMLSYSADSESIDDKVKAKLGIQ